MTGQWSYEAVPSTISTPMPLAGHDCQVVMADAGTDSISTPMPLAGHDPLRWDKSCPDKLFLLPCPSRGMTGRVCRLRHAIPISTPMPLAGHD